MALATILRKTNEWWRGEEGRTAPEMQSSDAGTSIAGHRPRRRVVERFYGRILAGSPETASDEATIVSAWKALEDAMALVPAADVDLWPITWMAPERGTVPPPDVRRVRVASLYMDRWTVTNEAFAEFVTAGGYREPKFWPAHVLPQVLHFVDQTGAPGPRFWSRGEPPRGKRNHPVTGVSWYEASAYASWVGKRLPGSAEWQRAACWSDDQGAESRYPWGNSFAPNRANTWVGGPGDTVAVDGYYEGCTPNGIYQLTGNVWEWTGAAFDFGSDNPECEVLAQQSMAEVRGGAFDTYFETQATCQFRSGYPLLYRGANVGFRCCISAEGLRTPCQPVFS